MILQRETGRFCLGFLSFGRVLSVSLRWRPQVVIPAVWGRLRVLCSEFLSAPQAVPAGALKTQAAHEAKPGGRVAPSKPNAVRDPQSRGASTEGQKHTGLFYPDLRWIFKEWD